MITLLGFIVLVSSCLVDGGPCDNAVSVSTSWPGGYTATLLIPITSTVNTWTLDVTFSAAISRLEVWNALSTSSNLIKFRLTNMSYNGAQSAGTIMNQVGFNVWYPSNNAMPTTTSIVFNSVNICSAVTTTVAPTTTTAPTTIATTTTVATTTAPPTTTTAATTTSTPGSCSTAASISSAWQGGFTATLIIPITSSVTSWTIDVTFSAALSSLQIWNAISSTTNNMNFKFTSMSYNGVQNAGTIFNSVGFNAYYPSSSAAPVITNVKFNGVSVCSGGTTTTTTIPTSTTAPPTTSTLLPTTTTTQATVTTTANTATTTQVNPSSTAAPMITKYNYSEVITKSLLFYYAQRSGRLPTNDNPIPYRSDSALGDVGQNGEDLTGGYYDAGDFVKFGFPMASMTTVAAWSVIDYSVGYSSAGQMANAQNMVKWASDYFIKAHVAPNKLYGQVGDGYADHSYWGRPEDMTMSRPVQETQLLPFPALKKLSVSGT